MERVQGDLRSESGMKGGYLGLGSFEMVRYKAIVEEIFQAWVPKERISTTSRATAVTHL